jgi:hypothetical protein
VTKSRDVAFWECRSAKGLGGAIMFLQHLNVFIEISFTFSILLPGEVTKCTYGTPTCETILDPLSYIRKNYLKNEKKICTYCSALKVYFLNY